MANLKLSLLTGLTAALASSALAGEVIYDQPYDAQTSVGPMNKTITSSASNGEVTDDFDLVGRIEQITFPPQRSYPWSAPPPINGVTVRFYAWNSGVPGALQSEQYIPQGANLYVSPSWSMDRIDITLPTAFVASGKHFVSVQIHTDEAMFWYSANTGAPKGAPALVRQRTTATAAWTRPTSASDVSFTFNGVLTGTPFISSVSATSVPRSGRLIVNGQYFGSKVGQILVNGVPAILAGWSSTAVKGYIPEGTALGTALVKVVCENGTTNEFAITVTNRASEGKIKWKFQLDDAYTQGTPEVAPDGTVYVTSGYSIYALTPTGGLKWIHGSLPWYDRIDVGKDGTLYTSCNDEVYAINPDGTTKWKFDPPFAGNWPNSMGGPNVGPDGNIYVVHNSIAGGEGIYSLTPLGQLRWKYQNRVGEYKPTSKRIVFTPGQVHMNIEHEENGTTSPYMNELLTLGLDGSFKWRRQYVSAGSPAASPNGDVYAINNGTLTAFSNTGMQRWQAPSSTTPNIGPDSTIYTIQNNGLYHVALSPSTGAVKWSLGEANHNYELHTPSKVATILMGSGLRRDGTTPDLYRPYIQSVSATGTVLWRQYIPNENTNPQYPGYGYILPYTPTFSPDGATAYYGSFHNADYGFGASTYLYAVDTSSTGGTTDPAPLTVNSQYVAQTVPASMTAGRNYTVTVTMKNTGTATWTAGTHYLAPVPTTGTYFNQMRVDLPTGSKLAPGASIKLTFSVMAPNYNGTYPMSWRLRTSSDYFGAATPTINVKVSGGKRR